ncbi:UHRF1-binding protein 1-like protein [Elysia marginata]|uniref:UHRF1-binding protein 1-like protein n=1 Tax=Elysia marginata TaxID=1093978 RepID=A0AAV4HTE1_9GAST|nr:UHRF1-binding protein 1-like protein [Elysia marginata]
MDGIYVHVNSVLVKLMSHKFHASLQLSRVKVQSMSPTWQTPSDLRSTRIRDPGRGEVLLFKEIEWQTTRIEATAAGAGQDCLTPLRLIANQAKIRIVVKKRLADSAIISSRLTLLLDDLLWVLTITQLKAAILYANSLKVVIERSAQQSKRLAAEKLKKQGHMSDSAGQLQHQHHHHQQRSGQDRQETSTARYFSRFDVLSTSYHLITSRFDLHLCDDSSPGLEEKRHWKINGGSMQITFNKLSLDFYPFHPAAGGERKAWHRYSDNVGSRNPWVHKLFADFKDEAVRLRRVCDQSGLLAGLPSSSSAPSLLAAQPVGGAPPGGGGGRQRNLAPGMSHSVNSSPVHMSAQAGQNPLGSRSAQGSPQHQPPPPPRSTRLLETCFVVKVEDVTVYMVSMPGQKRSGPTKLVSSDKRQLHLPPDMSVLHVEFTDYFFPDGLQYPVKSSDNVPLCLLYHANPRHLQTHTHRHNLTSSYLLP